MPLESATHITDLNTANPVGSTDKVQTLDDHVRLIKSVLKTDINLAGAVTASHTELNILDGATLSTAELNILDGVTLTAAQINDAARKSVQNSFTDLQTITVADAATGFRLHGSTGRIRARPYVDSTNGAVVESVNAAENAFLPLTFSATVFRVTGGTGIELTGALTTPNTTASEVGYKGAPQNEQNGNYGLVLTDAGKTIYKSSGGAGETVTIPANGSVAFPVGTIIRIVNNGGGDLTIAITTDTLSLAGVGTTGSRTLSDHGVAVIEKVASTEWFISGVGLS